MDTILKDIKYNDQGLVPAIIQDYSTREVLMMAYMNEESLKLTLETKRTWFYSRSREKLWNKGESSGNVQEVKNVSYDCDGDTLLVEVVPAGPACHTGERTCFYRELYNSGEAPEELSLPKRLYNLILDRKTNPKEGSYTNYLFEKGIDKILKKVGEEAGEVIIASKNEDKAELVYEASDLAYHLMVLLVEKEITLDEISEELAKRYK